MNRLPFSRVAVLLAAMAFVIAIDAIIVVAPMALADPVPTATATAVPLVAVATPTATPTASPTLATPDPTDSPTPEPTATPTPAPTPVPTPRDTVWNARIYAKNRLGTKNYDCISNIFMKESKWNPYAGTPTGAYGIPQAFPGSKMASFGSNWRYSPLTQVKWGIWYVNSRYGSACAAWDFWQSNGWY